jgi:predicted DNA-binding ribbon-helix-helix protein
MNSLCNKFTASGDYHNGAFEHLDSMDLVQLTEDSGANNFASKARVLSLAYLKTRTTKTSQSSAFGG